MQENLTRARVHVVNCRQHFTAAVDRISKISGIIPIMQRKKFKKQALALLKEADSHSFQKSARKLVTMYPKIEPWMDWWTRDSHAPMLFFSERLMDSSLWDALPNTTNAEEAMHHCIYASVGRDHSLRPGIHALERFARHFEDLVAGINRMCSSHNTTT